MRRVFIGDAVGQAFNLALSAVRGVVGRFFLRLAMRVLPDVKFQK